MLESGAETWDTLLKKSGAKVPDAATDPEKYRGDAERFVEAMKASRAALDATKPLIGSDAAAAAKFNRLSAQYQGLLEKFKEAGGEGLGAGPLLIVFGIAFVAVAAIAWAVAMAPYAEGHKLQAQAFLREVEARDTASKEGRVLAPGTTPPPPAGPGIDWKVWAPVVGVVGTAILGIALARK